MDNRKSNHMISVDSETGVYWDGQRALITQTQINAALKPALIKRSSTKDYVARGQILIQFAAMRILRTTARFFEINSLRLM